MPDARALPRRVLRDCSRAGHRLVTPLAAAIVERGDDKVLVENGVCRLCGAAVQRITQIRDQGDWGTVISTPAPEAVLYACVALRQKAALS